MDMLELPPEILRLIGEILDRGSLVNSVRACRSWNLALIPILYKTLDNSHHQPSSEVLARLAHHIRHLKLRTAASKCHLGLYSTPPGCSNLKQLDLNFRKTSSRQDLLSAVVLVLLNRTLLKLKIEQDPFPHNRSF